MKIIKNTMEFHIPEKTAVAIGKFDGIHKGHRLLLTEILKAKDRGLASVVFTFDISPAAYFSKQTRQELTTLKEKEQCFSELGIDYLVEYPFNERTASVEPAEYVEDFILDKMNAKLIVAGEDVSYGSRGAGDAKLLKRLAEEAGSDVKLLQKIKCGEREISSTLVKEYVRLGDMEMVSKLLGEPFFVTGVVEKGNQIGRTMGFPTINLLPPKEKILPPNGVYFSRVVIDGRKYYGVSNIGTKPTVADGYDRGVETFLYDFSEEIYGKEVCVSLEHFVRPEQRFEDISKLQVMIDQNVIEGRKFFGI